MHEDIKVLTKKIQKESAFIDKIKSEVAKVIVGQETVLERLLIGLLANGHILLDGVPGLAKTLMVKTLSSVIDTKFQRLQFTPDLLPADITGTMIWSYKEEKFLPKKGPIFSNLILADEINRAPAKVQSALLQAMQERQVTIGDHTYTLEEPFLVLATKNPIELEGTYKLPEAQVDRFFMNVMISYPDKKDELKIMRRMSSGQEIKVETVVSPDDILNARSLVNEVYINEKLENYILDIVFATRNPQDYGLPDMEYQIEYGASPRASIYINLAAKAQAFIKRRGYVTPYDIKTIVPDVLRHRIILTYKAEAEDVTTDDIIEKIFDKIEVP
jgi:MoxR-like ATPase